VIGLGFLYWQVRLSRKDAQDQRVVAFQDHFMNREFATISSKTVAFLDALGPADCVQKFQVWAAAGWADDECLPRSPRLDRGRPAKNDIQHTLGTWEIVGAVYNRGDLTREVILESFCTPAVQMFSLGWWYICWRRDGRLLAKGVETYAQFERFVRHVRAAKAELDETYRPNLAIRVLCLPENLDATPQGWARCEAISETLSKRVLRKRGDDVATFGAMLDDLLKAVDHVANAGKPGEPLKVTLLPIPRDMDLGPADWEPTRNRAEHAARRMSSLTSPRIDLLISNLGGTPPAPA
jgi:hypothetical protein